MKTLLPAGNIYQCIPEQMPEEVFEPILTQPGLKVERILSKGHVSPKSGWYDQENHEWIMVVKGEAVLEFENNRSVNLKAGDYFNIPAHERHRVSWTDAASETIWLAVHYTLRD